MEIASYQKLLLGIRSEDIACQTSPSYHFNLIKFSAKVNFEENLGSHKNIYFKLGESNFCVSANAQTPKEKEMEFSINPRDLYFFDFETKEPIVSSKNNFSF